MPQAFRAGKPHPHEETPSKASRRTPSPGQKKHPGQRKRRLAARQNRNQNQNQNHGQGSPRCVAVIDLGTNNCRLLIAQFQPMRGGSKARRHFRVIDSFSRIVRLGEGLSQSGVLQPEAMERTLEALRICAKKIHRSGATQVRAVATQACRQARNGPAFLARIAKETGLEMKTINTLQEVQLGVASAKPLLKRRWPYALIFDIGGGSTEVSLLKFRKGYGFGMMGSLSLPQGVVSLAETYGSPGQDLSEAAYGQIRLGVAAHFAAFAAEHGMVQLHQEQKIQTVGMSGTVTTVKALDLALTHYQRSLVDQTLFDMDRLTAIRDSLMGVAQEDLRARSYIGAGRADLVLPGMAILQGLADVFAFQRLLVLDRGLREGLLYQVFAKPSRRRSRQRVKAPLRSPGEGKGCSTAGTQV